MALCRFKIDDNDYKEFVQYCNSIDMRISDVLRSFVATKLNRNVATINGRKQNGGHQTDTKVATKVERGHQTDTKVATKVERGHQTDTKVATNLNIIKKKEYIQFDPKTGKQIESVYK